MASCVTLYKNKQNCQDAPTTPCCTTADKAIFGNVWSLTSPDGTDNLLTNNRAEHDVLVRQGWRDNCSPITGPTDFCVDNAISDGRNGPFILFNATQPKTIPLYRCITPQNKHFISLDSLCENMGKAEAVLGFISVAPSFDTVRALRRCRNGDRSILSHALDLACDINDSHILGWVR